MEQKIPKLIHYCWFGDKEKPELVKKCIESWKKFLPDYEIREWNNLDLEICTNQYVKEAAECKKWAFVSDWFRLYALYNFGGIYFDSDNEVFKSFDEFLNLDFFTGYERYKTNIHSFTAVVGAKKGNAIIKNLLDEYNNITFYDEYGELNLTTNTQRVEDYFKNMYNLKPPFNPNRKFVLEKNCIVYPANYFCSYEQDISYAVHHFNGSWVPDILPYKRTFITKKLYYRIYTISKGTFFKSIKNINEIPIFAYPRYNKRTILLTLGKKND